MGGLGQLMSVYGYFYQTDTSSIRTSSQCCVDKALEHECIEEHVYCIEAAIWPLSLGPVKIPVESIRWN